MSDFEMGLLGLAGFFVGAVVALVITVIASMR